MDLEDFGGFWRILEDSETFWSFWHFWIILGDLAQSFKVPRHFGDHFWSPFGAISEPLLGPNPAPFWDPLGSHFGRRFGAILGALLEPFLAPFWSHFGASLGSIPGSILGPFLDPKSTTSGPAGRP